MKRSPLSHMDPFAVSPMLALLPVRSQVGKLSSLTSFFYARYEKVAVIKNQIEQDGASAGLEAVNSELAMLREVLEWLDVSPEPADKITGKIEGENG